EEAGVASSIDDNEEEKGINRLPPEVLAHILSFLSTDPSQLYVLPARLVCSLWRDLLPPPKKPFIDFFQCVLRFIFLTENFHPYMYCTLLAKKGQLTLHR